MVLTGKEIKRRLGTQIKIDPFQESRLNPNSYNLTLHEKLLVYTESPLDMKKENPTEELRIPPEGLVLKPGKLYLGRTVEYTESHDLVPMLEGRSSIGRLGLFVHVTAGFGDTGYCGVWTLEIQCVEPIRIYAGVEICQIFYHEVRGEVTQYQSKKYQSAKDVAASRLFLDFV